MLSCDDTAGPVQPVRAVFGIAPVFEQQAAGIVPIGAIRFILNRGADGALARDTTIQVPPGADSVDLLLTVPVLQPAETFALRLELMDSAGAVVFRGGPVTVTPATGGAPPPIIAVPLAYTGTGANAAAVQILTTGAMVLTGQSVLLNGVALDSASQPIPGTPIEWRSLDSSRAVVPVRDSGRVLGGAVRGNARIVARLLTGQADTVTVAVQPLPSAIRADSGSGQTAVVDSALGSRLVAQVTAADGLGVRGVWVRFTVTAGGGIVSADSVRTDSTGRAGLAWTLGPTAGTQSVQAATPLLGATATFTATALAGPPDALIPAGGDGQTAVAGTAVPVRPSVVLQDAHGNPVPSVPVRFEVLTGGGALTGTSPVTDAAGVATLGSWTLGPAAGPNTIRAWLEITIPTPPAGVRARAAATAGAAEAAAAAALDTLEVFFTAQGVAGTPTSLILVSGDGQTGMAGAALGQPLVVRAEDTNGNPTAGAAIAWTVTAGGGVVSVDTVLTDSAGLAAVAWTLGTAAGAPQQVDATVVGGAASVVFSATATPGPASTLAFTVPPSSTPAGTAMAPAVEVAVQDALGNTILADSATVVTLAISAGTGTAGAVLTGTTGQPVTGGLAAFGTLVIDSAGTGYRLEATASGLTTAVSGPFDILLGPAASVTLTPGTATLTSLTETLPFTAEVRDAGGNLNPGAPVTWSLSDSSVASVSATGLVTALANGVTDVIATSGPVADTAALTVAQAATQLAFTVQPSATAAADTITPAPAVSAQDALGNVVAGFTNTITVAIGANPSSGVLTGLTAVPAAGGVAQFGDLSINAPGAGYTLVATATGLTPDTSAAFTVTTASSVQWINAAGGAWSNGANWSTGAPPAAGDSAIIGLSGSYTVTVDVNATVAWLDVGGATGTQTVSLGSTTLTVDSGATFGPTAALSLSGGALTGAGLVTIQGTLDWSGGGMTGLGTTRLAPGASGAISGTAGKTLVARRFENAGSLVHSGTGDLQISTLAALVTEVTGTFESQTAGGDVLFGGGGGAVVENFGTHRATSGGSNVMAVRFTNRPGATFEVLGGTTLSLTAGTDTLDGTVNVALGSTIGFAGANGFLPNSVVVTGQGFLQQVTGTVTVGTLAADSVIVPRFLQGGGTLTGPGVLVIADTLGWTGGVMEGTGRTAILDTVTATLSGTAAKTLGARTFENFGSVVHVNTGDLSIRDFATFVNQPTGTYEFQTAGGDVVFGGGVGAFFENRGTLRVASGGLNQQHVQVAHRPGALLELTAGTDFALTSGTDTLAGAVTLAAGSRLRFVGANGVFPGGLSPTGAGLVEQTTGTITVGAAATDSVFLPRYVKSGGTTTGPGVLILTDSLDWGGGTMDGTGVTVVLDSVTATVSGGAAKTLAARTFANFGTVLHSGTGDLSIRDLATFVNAATGTYEFQTAGGDVTFGGGGGAFFENAGTYRVVSGGLNQQHVQLAHRAGALLELTGGSTLNLTSGVDTLAGPVALATGTSLQFTGADGFFPAGFTPTGGGFVRQTTGTLTIGGAAGDSVLLARFDKTGGTTTGPGVLVITDTLSWSGGTFDGTGVTATLDTVTTAIHTASTKTLSVRTFDNAGTVIHTETGDLSIRDLARFVNGSTGTYEFRTAGGDVVFGGGAGAFFENFGAYRVVSGGLNQQHVELAHRPGALLELTAGSQLNLTAGDDTLSGAVTLAPGADLQFTGAAVWLTDGFAPTGDGFVRQLSGAVTIGGAVTDTVTLRRLSVTGGTTAGPGVLVLADTLDWAGGVLEGSGVTLIPDTVTAVVRGTPTKTFGIGTLENFGTLVHQGTGDLSIRNGGQVLNRPSGTYEMRTAGGDIVFGGGAGAQFNNLGTWRKSAAGANLMGVNLVLGSASLLDIVTGTLTFPATLTDSAGATIQGGGTLNLTGTIGGGTLLSDVRPGTSPGIFTFTGQAYPQDAQSTLFIELGGTTPGTGHDQLVVGGAVTLDGALAVDTAGGFVPAGGDAFPIVVATGGAVGVGGTFTLTLPSITGVTLDTAFSAARDTLFVVAGGPSNVNTWTGGAGDGLWSSTGNWSAGAAPVTTDTVLIDLAGSYTVTYDVPVATIAALELGGGAATPTLDFAGLTVLNVSDTVHVHSGATLRLNATTRLQGNANVTVDGTFDFRGGTIGGAGLTRITSGGTLTMQGPDGKTVDTRTLSNAGTASWADAGSLVGSAGAVILNDVGGTLTVSSSGGFFIFNPPSPIFENRGTLIRTGNTFATTFNETFVNSGTIDLQAGVISMNSATGTWGGTVTVASGAQLRFDGGTHVWNDGLSLTGPVVLAGSGVTVPAAAAVTLDAPTVTGGVLTVTGTLAVPGSINRTGGILQGTGTVDLTGATVSAFDGAVNPGTSPGLLTVQPFPQGAGGILNIELGGRTPGSGHDLLVGAGTATLGGALAVDTIGGFSPVVGDTFPILVYDAFTGAFPGGITFPTISGVTLDTLTRTGGTRDTLFLTTRSGPCGTAPNSQALVTVSLTNACASPDTVGTVAEAISVVQAGGIVQFESGGGSFTVTDQPVNKPVRFQSADAGTPTIVTTNSGFQVNGVASGTVSFVGLAFQSSGNGGVFPSGTYDQVVVDSSTFVVSGTAGVQVAPSSVGGAKVTVRNSTFSFSGGLMAVFASNNPVVVDIINNQVIGPSSWGAFQLQSGATGRIESNTATDCGVVGCINVRSNAVGVVVTGNTVSASPGIGATLGIDVGLSGSTGATVTNNTVSGGFTGGNPADPANYGYAGGALRLTGTADGSETVSGNTLSGAAYGIQGAVGGTLLSAQDNIISTVLTGFSNTVAAPFINNDVTTYVNPFELGVPAGTLICNWWGDPNGPANVPGGADPAVFTPWATGPIAQGGGGLCNGVSVSWVGGDAAGPTDWSNPNNWSGGFVPGAIHDVAIPLTASQPVLSAVDTVLSLTVQAGATLSITAGDSLYVGQDLTAGYTSIAGAGTVVLSGAAGLASGRVANLEIRGAYSLADSLILTGDLEISAGSLDLGGWRAAVGGNLRTTGTGALVMNTPADSLVVAGDATFSGGSTNGLLTDGILAVAGDFTKLGGDTAAFLSDGAHTVVLNGAGAPQAVSFDTTSTLTDARSQFRTLRIENPQGITFTNKLVALQDIQVVGTGPILGDTLALLGNLTTAGNVTVDELLVGGVLGVSGGYAVTRTEFFGTGQTIPAALPYQDLEVTGTATAEDGTATTGFLEVSNGGLTLAGKLTVGTTFETVGPGTLTMLNAGDTLDVAGAITFAGGSTAGRLTAGRIIARGDFVQGVTVTTESFAASAGHVTEFAGVTFQGIDFATPDTTAGSHFGDILVSNKDAVGVQLFSPIFADGQLRSPAAAGNVIRRIGGSSAERITARGLDADSLVLDGVPLTVVDGSAIARFDAVEFRNQDQTVTQFELQRVSGTHTFSFLVWSTVPTSGLYLNLIDTDGTRNTLFELFVEQATPVNHSGFAKTDGVALLSSWLP